MCTPEIGRDDVDSALQQTTHQEIPLRLELTPVPGHAIANPIASRQVQGLQNIGFEARSFVIMTRKTTLRGTGAMPQTSQLMVQSLVEGGTTRALTQAGLGITWSLPAFMAQEKQIDVVLTRAEWIASVMAQATGRLTGRMGTLEAHISGSPMVALTETSDYDGYGQMADPEAGHREASDHAPL